MERLKETSQAFLDAALGLRRAGDLPAMEQALSAVVLNAAEVASRA